MKDSTDSLASPGETKAPVPAPVPFQSVSAGPTPIDASSAAYSLPAEQLEHGRSAHSPAAEAQPFITEQTNDLRLTDTYSGPATAQQDKPSGSRSTAVEEAIRFATAASRLQQGTDSALSDAGDCTSRSVFSILHLMFQRSADHRLTAAQHDGRSLRYKTSKVLQQAAQCHSFQLIDSDLLCRQ